MLAPTRELAVQVAEAMTEFSKHMRGVNVVALYGGQRYDVQLRARAAARHNAGRRTGQPRSRRAYV